MVVLALMLTLTMLHVQGAASPQWTYEKDAVKIEISDA